ncbi:hypothetical protein [Litoreibacter ascidiaceicola]|nr:hypothetical protein [Litoreibacter ascidiaceicola]
MMTATGFFRWRHRWTEGKKPAEMSKIDDLQAQGWAWLAGTILAKLEPD